MVSLTETDVERPQPSWASSSGRVVQVRDAAHTFIANSGNGATQAIEDALSLASCLQLGGKSNVPAAVTVHVKLHQDRISCCQYMGFVNRETYQHTNWDAVIQNPGAIKAKYGRWIWGHDDEAYVYESYGNAFRSLVEKGVKFVNSNIPPGYMVKR